MRFRKALSCTRSFSTTRVRLATMLFILSCQDTEPAQQPLGEIAQASVALPGGPGGSEWTVVGSVGHAAALLLDGSILVAGGEDDDGVPTATAQIYNPATGMVRPIGNMTAARTQFSATTLADGRVLLVGGVSAGSQAAPV